MYFSSLFKSIIYLLHRKFLKSSSFSYLSIPLIKHILGSAKRFSLKSSGNFISLKTLLENSERFSNHMCPESSPFISSKSQKSS
jgi:hypothetical protein